VTSILTPGYAPFEQYGSAGDQGPWTDIYALAATIYHGIAGKAPPDSVDRIRRDPMVPAVQAGAGRYSEPFLAAIDAGLKVDERERPQNAAQWRELFGGTPVPTMAPPTIQPVTVAPAAPPPVSVPYSQAMSQPVSQPAPSQRPSIEPPPPPSILSAPPTARAGSRGKMMIAAGVAVVLIGGGVAAALSMGGSSTPSAPQAVKPDNASIQLAAAEKERIEAEKKRTVELEKRLADEETRRKAAEESQAKVLAEAEKRRQAEEEARKKAEADAENKRRVDEENRKRAEAEAESRKRIEDETRKKVEAEFKTRAEEEAKKRQVEDETKRKAEEAKKIEETKKAEEAKKKAEDEAKKKAEQKPAETQTAASAAPTDPAGYVAQHWQVMRPQVEASLKARGLVADPASSSSMRFDEIVSYRVVRVTADTVVVAVTARFTRGSINIGVGVGARADFAETATFRNQSPNFPMISLQSAGAAGGASAASPPQQQAAAAAPPADPVAYVAQHWTVMRPQVEAALTKRGVVIDGTSGIGMRFDQIYSYRIVQVTPAQIVLTVLYRNARAVPGAGHTTGNNADVTETAIFQNQPPTFPLVGVRAAEASAPRPAQSAAAQSAEDMVRQNWPALKASAETFMAKKGSVNHPQSGYPQRFSSLNNNYKVVSVTPTTITLEILMLVLNSSGGSNIMSTTAVFQNQSGFPVVRID
jgi:actin-related protein